MGPDVTSLELERLFSLSEEELLSRLASESGLAAAPFPFSRKVAIGRALFAGWWEELKDRLCDQRRRIEESPTAETRVSDAAAIVDAIAATHNQVPAVTLSVLIVKYGLERLCSGWVPPAGG